jgi:hypothetical protein
VPAEPAVSAGPHTQLPNSNAGPARTMMTAAQQARRGVVRLLDAHQLAMVDLNVQAKVTSFTQKRRKARPGIGEGLGTTGNSFVAAPSSSARKFARKS